MKVKGVVMLVGLLGLLTSLVFVSAAHASFSDVGAGNPYATAIQVLADRGIIEGYGDGTFGPGDTVKRAQYAKMVVGLFQLQATEADASPFIDLGLNDPASPYPHSYVAVAWRHGLTLGTSEDPPRFSPYNQLSRYQAITMLSRGLLELRPETGHWRLPGWVWDSDTGFGDQMPEEGEPDNHQIHALYADYYGLLDWLPTLVDWDAAYIDDAVGYRWATRGEVAQLFYNALVYTD